MVIKIVHDHLVEMLGGAGDGSELAFNAVPPVPVLMVGLQGSGKTTSTAQIALRLPTRGRKQVRKIGRASGRERGGQYASVPGDRVCAKKTLLYNNNTCTIIQYTHQIL